MLPNLSGQLRTMSTMKPKPEEKNTERMMVCYRCGRDHLRKDCFHRNTTCYHCRDPNHLRHMCTKKHLPTEVAKAQIQRKQNMNQ